MEPQNLILLSTYQLELLPYNSYLSKFIHVTLSSKGAALLFDTY